MAPEWSKSPESGLDIEPDKLRLCNRAITVLPSRTIYYNTRDLNQISVSNQSPHSQMRLGIHDLNISTGQELDLTIK